MPVRTWCRQCCIQLVIDVFVCGCYYFREKNIEQEVAHGATRLTLWEHETQHAYSVPFDIRKLSHPLLAWTASPHIRIRGKCSTSTHYQHSDGEGSTRSPSPTPRSSPRRHRRSTSPEHRSYHRSRRRGDRHHRRDRSRSVSRHRRRSRRRRRSRSDSRWDILFLQVTYHN